MSPPSVGRPCPSQCVGNSVSKFQAEKYPRYFVDISCEKYRR